MTDTPDTSDQFFLGRQPILDQNQRLVAYELLFRSSQSNAATVTDGVRATATVIANAFTELGVTDALGSCRGFINVDEHFLFSDVLEILPRQSVVLEILETVPPTPEVVARARHLKELGFTLALDDVIQIEARYAELLALVDIIKVDIHPLTALQLQHLAQRLKPLGKQMLAEKVDSREQMELCLNLGFTLFQGYFFAKPTIIAGKKLDHSQLALLKLMNLLLGDADTGEIETALKPQPGLTLNLLRMTNSVGSGTRVKITSLRHAITVLGRRQLQRWLQLLLFSTGKQDVAANPLLITAATRGRLMEKLSAELPEPQGGEFADHAFMVGIMSLMPALVGQPIADIVAPLGMPPRVVEGLCAGTGTLGDMLRLVEATESGNLEQLQAALHDLGGMRLNTVNRCLAEALQWASSIGQEAPHKD